MAISIWHHLRPVCPPGIYETTNHTRATTWAEVRYCFQGYVYLCTCCNWGKNGRLEAHGKVEGEDEGGEVDCCEGKPLSTQQVNQVIIGTPEKGETGQGERAAQREQEGELSWVNHEHGKEGDGKPKADHAQDQTCHESDNSLFFAQTWKPFICFSAKPALRSTTVTTSIVNLKIDRKSDCSIHISYSNSTC